LPYWILKTNPTRFNYDVLEQSDQIAFPISHIKQSPVLPPFLSAGDVVLIYHAGNEQALVGVALVTNLKSKPEPNRYDLYLTPQGRLKRPVSSLELKMHHQMLSPFLSSKTPVVPVSDEIWHKILELSRK
jgi:predicted RNA-binding protein with PUA-like domain